MPMYLHIDLSTHRVLAIALLSDAAEIVHEIRAEGRNVALLQTIGKVLAEANVARDTIRGVAIVQAAGGFTSTRLAAVVANGWHHEHGIPVIGVEAGTSPQDIVNKLKVATPGIYLTAAYSGDPNINLKTS